MFWTTLNIPVYFTEASHAVYSANVLLVQCWKLINIFSAPCCSMAVVELCVKWCRRPTQIPHFVHVCARQMTSIPGLVYTLQKTNRYIYCLHWKTAEMIMGRLGQENIGLCFLSERNTDQTGAVVHFVFFIFFHLFNYFLSGSHN